MSFFFLCLLLLCEPAFPKDADFHDRVIKNFVQPEIVDNLKGYDACADRWRNAGTVLETVSQVLSYATPVLIFSGTYDQASAKEFSFAAGFSSVLSIAFLQMSKYSNRKALINYKNRDVIARSLSIELNPIPQGLEDMSKNSKH